MKNQKKLTREEMKKISGGYAAPGCTCSPGCKATEECITIPGSYGNPDTCKCESIYPPPID